MVSEENVSSTDGDFFRYIPNGNVRAGSRHLPLYPLVIGCLGLLNIILLSAAVAIGIYCGQVSEVTDPFQAAVHTLSVEKKQLHIDKTEALKDHQANLEALKREQAVTHQLQMQLERNATLSDNLQRKLQRLQQERATLQSSTSHIENSCGRCGPGWLLLNTSCYFHSKSASLPAKNWWTSRAECRIRGGNLTVIDNLEEQLNIFEYLPKLDPSVRSWWKGGGTWIGLTDAHAEGNWVWINNVTQEHGEGYWIPGEPNNYGPSTGEDCAAFVNIKHPRQTWFDASCSEQMDWLCEAEPQM